MAFELRITDAGRAALADGTNRGTNAIRLTKMAIGSGQGPGGEADDGRTALRTQKMVVALGGTTMVSGRIAVKGEFQPTEAFDVTELGLLGQIGNGAEELYAFWTDASDVLASTIAGTRLVIAGALDIQPAAAEVTVNVDASISLGDPAISASVTALGGRVDTAETDIDAVEGRMTTAETDIDAVEGRMTTAETDIDAVETRMGTAEGEIDALENADFGALIAALAARVTTLEGGTSVIRSIQRGSLTATFGSASATISSVNTSKSMVNLLSSIGAGSVLSIRLLSSTSVHAQGDSDGESITIRYEVIEFI